MKRSHWRRSVAALGPVARQAFGEPLDPGRLAALEQAILDRAAAPREGSTGDDS